jgi:hypothetical protein
MVIEKSKPSKDEAASLIKTSRDMSYDGKEYNCPRRGKPLRYIDSGSSYTAERSDKACISINSRGI